MLIVYVIGRSQRFRHLVMETQVAWHWQSVFVSLYYEGGGGGGIFSASVRTSIEVFKLKCNSIQFDWQRSVYSGGLFIIQTMNLFLLAQLQASLK